MHSRGHIWEHLARCEQLGRNLEVAVVIGAHPAINLAAAAKVAEQVDEFAVAGGLLGHAVRLVKCRTIDIEAPADAEYVIEGEILAGVHEDEGPYGEYTGYSTDRSTRNVFVVKAITHRARPIFHDIIPGYSAEHLLLGRATREAHIFLRAPGDGAVGARPQLPKIGNAFSRLPVDPQTAEGQARQALTLLLGLDPLFEVRRRGRRRRERVRRARSVLGAGDAISGGRRHVQHRRSVLQSPRSVVRNGTSTKLSARRDGPAGLEFRPCRGCLGGRGVGASRPRRRLKPSVAVLAQNM